jgi:hypothetical protein
MLTFAGLVSGFITVALCGSYYDNLDRSDVIISLGIPFGAIMAVCFVITGVTHNVLKVVCFFTLATCTLLFSVFLAMGLEVGAATHSIGTREIVHPIALFAGGMLGGFIILSGALLLQFKMRFGDIAREAIHWSALAGALSPVAWALGPSLGMWVWSALQAVGLNSPAHLLSESYVEAGWGRSSRLFALFVVWQTGMGFALGMALRKVRQIQEPSSSEELKLT